MLRQFEGEMEQLASREQLRLIEALGLGARDIKEDSYKKGIEAIRTRILGKYAGVMPERTKPMEKGKIVRLLEWLGRDPSEADEYHKAEKKQVRRAIEQSLK